MPWTKLVADLNRHKCEPQAGGGRILSYQAALREALQQALQLDKNVFVMGEGADDPTGIFGTTTDLHKEFGSKRVFDLPLAENAFTGFAVGAGIAGCRPVAIHQRVDFMLLTMDQLVNHAAKWRYMFGGKQCVPITVCAIIGRGWGSAAQHSQALEGLFMKVPGLKVVCPATPYDAKGLLLASIADNDPVIFIEHRWLFKDEGEVPKEAYIVPIGRGEVKRQGADITIISYSLMLRESLDAAEALQKEGINAEVIDLKTISPLDTALIMESVGKTGRAVIAELGWKTGGVGSEISAFINEGLFGRLKAPVERVALPDCPTPNSYVLEKEFYKGKDDIIAAVKRAVGRK